MSMADLHLPDYTPVYPVTKVVKPRQRKARLPDWGTEQRATIGQNQTSPEWDVRWVLNPAQANTLDAFLAERAKKGEWFLWTPPGGTQGRFRCEEWTKTLTYCSIREVQASFRQVFSYNLPSMGAGAGYFVLSGKRVARSPVFRPTGGGLTLVGNEVTLLKTRPILTSAGVFALTGADVSTTKSRGLAADAGVFVVAGPPAAFAVPTPTAFLTLYPNAAVAYSLRQLNTSTSDPVVEVRRSSDNATQNFTATEVANGTLQAWVGSGDGFVKTWYDQSGNARHATQATDANQPNIVSGGSILLYNNRPTVACLSDGSTVRLATGNINALVQPLTVYMPYRWRVITGNSRNLLDGNSADSLDIREENGNFEIYSGNFLYAGSVGRNTSRNLISLVLNSGSSRYYNNGALVTTGNAGTGNPSGLSILNYAGGFRSARAEIPELIVYTGSSLANLDAINANINTYYGIY